jgi:recombinational DNA repair ATPase RecF
VLPTVLFCPEDLLILKMGSSQRRRFGDLALCQLRPNYDAALTEYPDQTEHMLRFLRSRLEDTSDQKEVKKAIDALLRRGHSYAEIRSALQQMMLDPDEFPEE